MSDMGILRQLRTGLARFSIVTVAKSANTQAMGKVQARVRQFLQELGWRERSRAFNRLTSDGLTQVIEFQLGRFDPPGTRYLGHRQNLYGKFTVNIGVYVPEVDRYTSTDAGNRSFVKEPDCCIRQRLGRLDSTKEETWWDLKQPYDQTAADVFQRIRVDAFPFLTQFETRDAILEQLTPVTEKPYAGGRPPRIVCAIILAVRGHRDEARCLLRAQALEHRGHPHYTYVCDLADKLELGRLGFSDS